MTPNKPPPLPELVDSVAKAMVLAKHADEPNGRHAWDYLIGDAKHYADRATELKNWRLLASAAAEALRQSQSLPAGAVAGLVGKWRDYAGKSTRPEAAYTAQFCADQLEQALQADAREKGEAVRAADAVFAFSAMLTSLPKVVPFGAAAWATPGVELAVAFLQANGLGECSADFPGALRFPDIEGKLLAVVEQAAAATQPAQASEARVKPSASIASFPVDVLGAPMREYAPGKWESATWPSEALATSSQETASE